MNYDPTVKSGTGGTSIKPGDWILANEVKMERIIIEPPWPPDSFTKEEGKKAVDMVNHPSHYTSHPCGMEVIEITKHETFCIGNAIKYLMRYKLKGNPKQDLEKAVFYINKEIESYAD